MDHQTFSWTHPEFNTGDTGDCIFCAIAGVDGLSYCILGKDQTLLALNAWDFAALGGDSSRIESAIRSVLATDTLYNRVFAERRCAVSTSIITLVPKRFFKPDTLPDYFKLLMKDKPCVYNATELQRQDLWAVYAVEQDLNGLLEQFFQSASSQHILKAQLAAYHAVANPQKSGVYIHVRGYSLYITVVDRQHLLFYNSFRFDSPGDFLYYVLLAYEQCRLKPDTVPLYISGNMLENGAVYRNLFRYVQHIQFLGMPGAVQLSKSVSLPNKHLFFDLFALASLPAPEMY